MGKLKKRCAWILILALLCSTIFTAPFIQTAYAVGPYIYVAIDGKPITYYYHTGMPYMDAASRVQVPLRLTMETFGCTVSWSDKTKTAIVTKAGTSVKVPVGQNYITINGVKKVIDTSAQIKGGRVYLPIRPVIEAFGATVKWMSESNIVAVVTKASDVGGSAIKSTNSSTSTSTSSTVTIPQRIDLNSAIAASTAAGARARNTQVQVVLDSSIPAVTQAYINQLTADIDPVIRKFLGEPLQNRQFTLKYDTSVAYNTLNSDGMTMTLKTLPNPVGGIDRRFDDVYLINYIRQYYAGGDIPIPGSRYGENLAHPTKELVAEYLATNGLRNLPYNGVNKYLAAYPAYRTLKPEVILDAGAVKAGDDWSSGTGGFSSSNFLLEDDTYNRMNPFALEYAKSVWLTVAYSRYQKTGTLDFFYQLKEQLAQKSPKTQGEFEAIMEGLTGGILGETAAEWIRQQSMFHGSVDEKLTLNLFVAAGSYRNVSGRNNPDYIYPFVIQRTPGKLLNNVEVRIAIADETGRTVLEQTIRSNIDNSTANGLQIAKDSLKPGKYTAIGQCTVDGVKLEDRQPFYVYDAAKTDGYWMGFEDYQPVRNTKVTVSYDSSVPSDVQNYINELIRVIDPAMRKIAGEPVQDNHMTIKHDPNGLDGMNANMTVLNLKILPRVQSGVDGNFDSFFFIEYFHMFHRGSSIPIENARYTENISQAMKLVVSHYLKQYGFRTVSDQPIPYHLNLLGILDPLGPGVFVNLGPDNGNPGNNIYDPRKYWLSSSKFASRANVFTYDFGSLSWLKLADSYQERHGEYGFFRELLSALATKKPVTKDQYYSLIDELVDARIDGKMAGEWLQTTALYQELPAENYFIDPLPASVNGSLITGGSENPNVIIPFAISRVSYAKIIENDYEIAVRNASGSVVFRKKVTPALGTGKLFIQPVPLPALPAGNYTVAMTVNCDGQPVTGTRTFQVH